MELVEVQNIQKISRENSHAVQALTDISLTIRPGEFTALCGPSGSGKTTLLNLIGCLDRPTQGKILLDGDEISRASQQDLTKIRLRKIGFIFQDFNLIPSYTALENIEYVLWLQCVRAAARQKSALEICSRFGIEKLIGRRPSKLSRGQQQRVAVARAIIHKPKIVLGDELTANLDHKTGADLMDFLKKLNQEEGMTFVYATHDPVMMERANRIVRMQDGKIINAS